MSESRSGITSHLASQSGLVMLGNLFTLFVGFPFQVYLARTLGAEQLGALGLIEIISQTAGSLFGFGLGFTLVRFVPGQIVLGEHRHVRWLLASVFSKTLLAGVFAAILIMFGGPYLVGWMPELKAYAPLFPFVGAMAVLGMLASVSQQALRAFLDIRHMVIVSSFLQLTLKVVIAIVLLWWGWALMGYFVAAVVSAGLAVAGMVWGLNRHFRRLDHTYEEILPETRKSWRSYSGTMYANSLLGIAGAPMERYLLAGVINLESVGVLMAVRQLQSLPQAFLQMIVIVAGPMFSSAKARGDIDEALYVYHIATDWICRLALPLITFFLFFGEEILRVYGKSFTHEGEMTLLIFAVASLAIIIIGPLGTMLNMLGKEKEMFKLNAISSVLSILLMAILLPFIGINGVALGFLFSNLYLAITAMRLAHKVVAINWWSTHLRRNGIAILVIFAVDLVVKNTGLISGCGLLLSALLLNYAILVAAHAIIGFAPEDVEIYRYTKSYISRVNR